MKTKLNSIIYSINVQRTTHNMNALINYSSVKSLEITVLHHYDTYFVIKFKKQNIDDDLEELYKQFLRSLD